MIFSAFRTPKHLNAIEVTTRHAIERILYEDLHVDTKTSILRSAFLNVKNQLKDARNGRDWLQWNRDVSISILYFDMNRLHKRVKAELEELENLRNNFNIIHQLCISR